MAAESGAGPAPTRRVSKVGGVAAQEFSLAASIGGVRGVVESVLPYTVFSLAYALTKDLKTSIVAALIPVVVLVIWRLIARETLSQAISGALVIVLGAYLASRTHSAVNFFLPNIVKNAGFAVGYTVSILVRWPLIGVVVGPVTGEMFAWRRDRARLTAYQWATWLWVGLFVVRLAVQVPLYLADNVTLLGTLNGTILGIPLFALTIWLSWLVLKPVPLAKTEAQRTAEATERTAAATERIAEIVEDTGATKP
ncbi:MAG TPA: DUF3159 domain-containing protein [Kineosporiaceae bacterium]|nr:DUF3159 domain-containing protein [Kineosporiaceae bacterium]